MLLLKLDKSANQPLFRQVYEQIRTLIDEEVIQDGEKLPSSRVLANQHGVNRTTVYKAYEELWSAGYLASKSGSYSFARKPNAPSLTQSQNPEAISFNWKQVINKDLQLLTSHVEPIKNIISQGNINFRVIAPDKRLMPIDLFRKCMNEVLLENGEELLDYGDPQGYFPLRQYLSDSMKKHGIHASPESILITNGAQDGIKLFLQIFGNRKLHIAIEAPSYEWALRLFKVSNVKLIPIDMTSQGMDLDMLEDTLKNNKVDFIYTIPNFHNPTGITTSQPHRERMISLSDTYQVPILEDGFEEEMKYFQKAVLPIKSLDNKDQVVYLGTFSKVLFPGLRVGWVVGNDDLIKHLTILKNTSDFACSGLTQAALERFCKKGYYDRHLKKLHSAYKKRMQVVLKTCSTMLDSNKVEINRPIGGYTLWMNVISDNRTESELLEAFESAGVSIAPGSLYQIEPKTKQGFRLSIARTNEEEIIEGINRIASVIN